MKITCLIVSFLIGSLLVESDVLQRRGTTEKNGPITAEERSSCRKNDTRCNCNESMCSNPPCFNCSGCNRVPDWLPRNTTELNMSGNNLTNVANTSFLHLPNLVSLNLAHCEIQMIQAGSFDNLMHLRVLHLSHNPKIVGLSAGLFSRLNKLSTLVLWNTQNICEFDSSFLYNLTDLSVFSYGKNHLINFPKFLTRQNHTLLHRLTELNLAFNNIRFLRGEYFRGLERLEALILNRNQISVIRAQTFLNLTALVRLELNYNPLYKLDADSFVSHSLTFLSLAKSEYRTTGNVTLLHGIPNLRKLNVSRSIGIMRAIFPLKHQTNLEVFSARQNELFDEDISEMLANVPRLRHLDLTDNNLNVLQRIPFYRLRNLTNLLLGKNWFITINATSLSNGTWKRLKRVDLSANPLICDCGIVWFRRWINATQITVDGREDIRCAAPEDVKNRLLSEIPHPTDVECFQETSDELLVATVLLVLLFYVFSFIVSVLYRFRWHLKYWYFQYQTKENEFHGWRDRPLDHDDFDAFISYNESDSKWIINQLSPHLETEYHLRLCIRQRDWLPGRDIVDNVVDSIENSRKTVLIVSNAFAVSHWCHFEMTMAQTKLFEDDRDNLILVLLEEIADCNMNPRLQLQMQKKTYIEWTDNQIGQQLFWAKLRRALSRRSQSVLGTVPPRELFISTS